VSPFDAAGLVGVALMLSAYAAAQLRWLDPLKATSLAMNLAGSSLVMLSLLADRFNLAAFIMEASWAAVALFGLARLAFTRRRGR
jgi:hypothetical protein